MVSAGAPGSWACWQVQTSPAPAVGPWRESGLLGHLLHQLVRVPRGVTQRRRRPGSGASDGSLVKSNPFIYPTLLLARQPREEGGRVGEGGNRNHEKQVFYSHTSFWRTFEFQITFAHILKENV